VDAIFASELDRYRDKSDYIFIDVREKSDYEASHFKGAINMPFDEIENKFPQLDSDKIYVLYCDKGTVSLNVARDFERRGYHAKSVIGGITACRGQLEHS